MPAKSTTRQKAAAAVPMAEGDEIEVSEPLNRREANHPRETYQTPANVVKDNNMNGQQKIDILQYWKADVEARLRAQGESMGGSNPISAEKEAGLAHEERLANQAIADLKE